MAPASWGMSTLWRKPDHYFDPYEYGGYLSQIEGSYHPKMPYRNAYTKKTCLWTGNGFTMPDTKPVLGGCILAQGHKVV